MAKFYQNQMEKNFNRLQKKNSHRRLGDPSRPNANHRHPPHPTFIDHGTSGKSWCLPLRRLASRLLPHWSSRSYLGITICSNAGLGVDLCQFTWHFLWIMLCIILSEQKVSSYFLETLFLHQTHRHTSPIYHSTYPRSRHLCQAFDMVPASPMHPPSRQNDSSFLTGHLSLLQTLDARLPGNCH